MGSLPQSIKPPTTTSQRDRGTRTMADTKQPSQLLTEIQSADAKGLKDVATVENPAAKHDMTMYGVEKFDKAKLKPTETKEKNVLPTSEDIKAAQELEKTSWRNKYLYQS